MQLCEQAAVEQNPDKLLQLVSEINRMLEPERKSASAPARDQAGERCRLIPR
jgi:hypothetical protein